MTQQERKAKAKKDYNEKQAKIQSLIGKMQTELKKHGQDEPITFAHVGDLGHVEDLLGEIVSFLTGEE